MRFLFLLRFRRQLLHISLPDPSRLPPPAPDIEVTVKLNNHAPFEQPPDKPPSVKASAIGAE